MSGKFVFPFAERRRERAIKEEDFDVPDEVPELVEQSDDEEAASPTDAEADELSAKAEALSSVGSLIT